jgi:hypothetical protein
MTASHAARQFSDLEPRFVCDACGQRRAEVRPDFDCEKHQSKADAGSG